MLSQPGPIASLLLMICFSLLALAVIGFTCWLIAVSKHKWMKGVAVVIGMLVGFLVVLLIGQLVHEFRMMLRGRSVVTRLEDYHVSHGQYPVALSQLGIDEAKEGVFYQRDYESSSTFYLWFGTGFGTVLQYDSQTRTWHRPR